MVEVYLSKVKCGMIEGCKVVHLNLMEVLNQCFHDIAAINLPPLPIVLQPHPHSTLTQEWRWLQLRCTINGI